MKFCRMKFQAKFEESLIKIEFFQNYFRLQFEDIYNKITIKNWDYAIAVLQKFINTIDEIVDKSERKFDLCFRKENGYFSIETNTDKTVSFKQSCKSELLNACNSFINIIINIRSWSIC